MSATRAASVSDSISSVTPAAIAWRSSAGVLPGPAKLTRSGGIGVSRATFISPAEATSNESTSPLRCWTTAGIGFAFTAYPSSMPRGRVDLSSATLSVRCARS